ncbi:MAG: hypothetical protein U0514_04145 [Candidatus Andersenbacteria bacterium]
MGALGIALSLPATLPACHVHAGNRAASPTTPSSSGAAEERLLPVSAKVLTGGDAAAYEQFVQDEVQRLYRFVVQQLEYHDALNDLAANEVSPYEIIDEAFARVIAAHGATPDKQQLALPPAPDDGSQGYRRAGCTARGARTPRDVGRKVTARTRSKRMVSAPSASVLDFWQLDQDLSQQDLLPDETPTPAEIEDMKARQNRDLRGAQRAAAPSSRRLCARHRRLDGR